MLHTTRQPGELVCTLTAPDTAALVLAGRLVLSPKRPHTAQLHVGLRNLVLRDVDDSRLSV